MKHILLAACAVAILSGCGSQGKQAAPTENPFLSEYTTPFQVPPFDQIKMEHYKPAFLIVVERVHGSVRPFHHWYWRFSVRRIRC